MTDILKRNLAPVTDEAWKQIEEQITRILKGNLSARSVVGVNGPHGWTLGAVNLGRLEAAKSEAAPGVTWGLRQVLPLVEIRVPFTLGIWDLDDVSRGNKAPELAAAIHAAQRAALFEESAVYRGFKAGGIQGILEVAKHKPVLLPKEDDGFAKAIEDGVHSLQRSGIAGPYELVLGRGPYQMLAAGDVGGYPLKKRVVDMLVGGSLHWSPALDGGALVSSRGGDFELTVGQDLSIGYLGHEGGKVELFLTESLTFRVLEPAAAVELKAK